jgi:hypothetical protein
LWRGKTVDRRHRVEVVESSGRQFVRLDGKSGAEFEAVVPSSLTFSSDGKHIAYAARRDGSWVVVRDGKIGRTWDAIGELAMSARGERLAYSAERAGRWHVVLDEQPGPGFDALLGGTLRFSEDGVHLAYVGSEVSHVRVVIDDHVGPRFEGVGLLNVSHDGSHVAYVARRGGATHVVLDGALGEPFDAVEHLVVGSHGRLAYAGRSGATVRVVWSPLDGPGQSESESYDAASGLTLSSDEQHLAWVARMGGADTVVVDGRRTERSYPSILPTSVAFRPRTSEVAFIARDGGDRKHVVVGERVSAPFDAIEGNRVVFSADGSRVAYTGRRGEAFIVVLDASEKHGGMWASRPVLSAGGTRAAYLVRRGRRMAVIVDDKTHDVDVAIDGTFAFSNDARHWACVAGSASDRELYFLVDGVRKASLDFEEVVSASGRFTLEDVRRGRADGVLRSWAAAEAELAAGDERKALDSSGR